MKKLILIIIIAAAIFTVATASPAAEIPATQKNAIVYMSDFGLKDGAVSAMHGVAYGVSSQLDIFNLTHEIPAFDIWAGSYRLNQTINFWPEGTVFVCVVDPGVGTDRKSVVAKTESGHFIVTPNNGTLTLVADEVGIAALREIDEEINRLEGSYDSYTFHGRDVYSYTGARLAAGVIGFEEVGPELSDVEMIAYQKASIDGDTIRGTIPILDVQYGNVWTNISQEMFEEFGLAKGEFYTVEIYKDDELVYTDSVPYVSSFGDVDLAAPLLYSNSLLNLSIALNWDNFAGTHGIESGPEWSFAVRK